METLNPIVNPDRIVTLKKDLDKEELKHSLRNIDDRNHP